MAKLIEATYGDALFELAVEESRVDSLYDEAGAVIEAFNDNPEFGRLLNHPEVEKGEKEELINCWATSRCWAYGSRAASGPPARDTSPTRSL